MLNFKVASSYALMFLLPLNMVGCTSANNKNKLEKTRMLGVPTATVETDPVILELEATVRKSPENADAWSHLTKAYFDSKHYDQAVQAGNMALQLNTENADTRKIVFVSGLRIASASLDGIRKDQPLTGSNLADAETLVGTIRQTLGETSLTETSTKVTQQKTMTSRLEKKKKKVRLITREHNIPNVMPTSNSTVSKLEAKPLAKPILISNKPIITTAKAVQKPVTQAATNNPFGAFQ